MLAPTTENAASGARNTKRRLTFQADMTSVGKARFIVAIFRDGIKNTAAWTTACPCRGALGGGRFLLPFYQKGVQGTDTPWRVRTLHTLHHEGRTKTNVHV